MTNNCFGRASALFAQEQQGLAIDHHAIPRYTLERFRERETKEKVTDAVQNEHLTTLDPLDERGIPAL